MDPDPNWGKRIRIRTKIEENSNFFSLIKIMILKTMIFFVIYQLIIHIHFTIRIQIQIRIRIQNTASATVSSLNGTFSPPPHALKKIKRISLPSPYNYSNSLQHYTMCASNKVRISCLCTEG